MFGLDIDPRATVLRNDDNVIYWVPQVALLEPNLCRHLSVEAIERKPKREVHGRDGAD